MQEKWHSWIDYRWGAWLAATLIACSWFRDRRQEMDASAIHADRWLLLGCLFATIIPTLRQAILERLQANQFKRWPRQTWSGQVHGMFSHSFVACLLVTTYGRVWTWAEIGFLTTAPWSWTIPVGLLFYRFASLAGGAITNWFTPAEESAVQIFRSVSIGCFLPRGRTAQMLQLVNQAILGPIHEEIVYRGFFVFFLGQLTGYPTLSIAFGLILCVTVHLYQGYWAIPSHALFFAIAVAIMYSPAGLLTVIVMHVANNLHHAWTLPGYVENYRAYLRDKRQQRLECPASAEVASAPPGRQT